MQEKNESQNESQENMDDIDKKMLVSMEKDINVKHLLLIIKYGHT